MGGLSPPLDPRNGNGTSCALGRAARVLSRANVEERAE